jgi:hypothetical protein
MAKTKTILLKARHPSDRRRPKGTIALTHERGTWSATWYPDDLTLGLITPVFKNLKASEAVARKKARSWGAGKSNPRIASRRKQDPKPNKLSWRALFGMAPDEKETKELLALHKKALKEEEARLRKARTKLAKKWARDEIKDIKATMKRLEARKRELAKKKNPRIPPPTKRDQAKPKKNPAPDRLRSLNKLTRV